MFYAQEKIIKALAALFLFILPFIISCSTYKTSQYGSEIFIDHRTIAVITASTFQEAEMLRQSLLQGNPLPDTTKTVPINKVDKIDPSLTKVAIQLRECQISAPIEISMVEPSTRQYVVLQRGGTPEHPCNGFGFTSEEESQNWTDTAGHILIGILYIGGIALAIVAPFLLF